VVWFGTVNEALAACHRILLFASRIHRKSRPLTLALLGRLVKGPLSPDDRPFAWAHLDPAAKASAICPRWAVGLRLGQKADHVRWFIHP
jgi:hypothetical protein